MRKHLLLLLAATSSLCVLLIPQPSLGDEIPKIAWRRHLGQPLENPGVRNNKSDIDDGYWQGAPVGGFSHAAQDYHTLFLRAQKTYIDKLWNGEYFRL